MLPAASCCLILKVAEHMNLIKLVDLKKRVSDPLELQCSCELPCECWFIWKNGLCFSGVASETESLYIAVAI